MKYTDSVPKEWKKRQQQLLSEIEKKRELFYSKYKDKIKKIKGIRV